MMVPFFVFFRLWICTFRWLFELLYYCMFASSFESFRLRSISSTYECTRPTYFLHYSICSLQASSRLQYPSFGLCGFRAIKRAIESTYLRDHSIYTDGWRPHFFFSKASSSSVTKISQWWEALMKFIEVTIFHFVIAQNFIKIFINFENETISFFLCPPCSDSLSIPAGEQ